MTSEIDLAVRRIDFYPSDFFGGVAGMTAELIGVYWIVCTLLYMSGGEIQTDDHRLKIGSGVSHQRLPGALRELVKLRKISISSTGAITQHKVTQELDRAKTRINKGRTNGKQGGRPRSEINDLEKPDGFPDEKLSTINHQPSTKDSVSNETAVVTPFPSVTPEKRFYAEVRRVLGDKAGGLGTKLKDQYDGDYDRALLIIEAAATKENPREWVGGVLRGDKPASRGAALAETKAAYKRMRVI